MENLPTFALPLHTIVLLLFYLLIFGYIVFTIIFYYHWQNYATSRTAIKQTYLAYFMISLPLIAIMGFSVLAI